MRKLEFQVRGTTCNYKYNVIKERKEIMKQIIENLMKHTRHAELDLASQFVILRCQRHSPIRCWYNFKASLRVAKNLKSAPSLALPQGRGNTQCAKHDKNLFFYSLIHLFTSKNTHPLTPSPQTGSGKCAFTLAEVFSPCRKVKLNFGFTLAEVLITLGIIGIVAAVTLPSLIGNYQKKQAVSQLKVAYSILSQAVAQAREENGDPLDWDYSNAEIFSEKYFVPYLNVIKKCPRIGNNIFCYAGKDRTENTLRYLNGDLILESRGTKTIALSNGMSLMFTTGRGNSGGTFAKIYVDINGAKGKSIIGKDVFAFSMCPDRGENHILLLGVNGANSSGVNNTSYMKDRDYLKSEVPGACNKNAQSGTGYNQGDFCSLLIQIDGWKIAPDYPW